MFQTPTIGRQQISDKSLHCASISLLLYVKHTVHIFKVLIKPNTLCPKSPSARFCCIFTRSPVDKIHITQCILPSFCNCRNAAYKMNWRNWVKYIVLYLLNQHMNGKRFDETSITGALGTKVMNFSEIWDMKALMILAYGKFFTRTLASYGKSNVKKASSKDIQSVSANRHATFTFYLHRVGLLLSLQPFYARVHNGIKTSCMTSSLHLKGTDQSIIWNTFDGIL